MSFIFTFDHLFPAYSADNVLVRLAVREVLAVRGHMVVLTTGGYVRKEDEERTRIAGKRELILKPDTSNDPGAALDRSF